MLTGCSAHESLTTEDQGDIDLVSCSYNYNHSIILSECIGDIHPGSGGRTTRHSDWLLEGGCVAGGVVNSR